MIEFIFALCVLFYALQGCERCKLEKILLEVWALRFAVLELLRGLIDGVVAQLRLEMFSKKLSVKAAQWHNYVC